ncbi:MAG: chromate transporter [Clostridiales bacterium]|nr:chromate transporter [Clostridiales bacterium]
MLAELFFSFLQIGLFSVGGGYVAIPLIRQQVVETNSWLTMAVFNDLVTIAEMTPGPIGINAATFVGVRTAGLPGAVAASLGFVLPSLVITSLLGWAYYRYRKLEMMRSILGGLRPVVVALIASAALGIAAQVLFGGLAPLLGNTDWLALAVMLGAFLALRLLKWNPILTMLLSGVVYTVSSLILFPG